MVKYHPQCRRPGFESRVKKIPLEEGMATHSSILAWRIPWTEEPGGLQAMGVSRQSDRTEQLALSCFLRYQNSPKYHPS